MLVETRKCDHCKKDAFKRFIQLEHNGKVIKVCQRDLCPNCFVVLLTANSLLKGLNIMEIKIETAENEPR
jgi:hypothetical protein